jgi:flagellar hook assembly protein FlgD
MIHYASLEGGVIRVAIYNVVGEKVRELLNASEGLGLYSLAWDGKDDRGSEAASGTYLVVILEPKHRHLLKVLVLK